MHSTTTAARGGLRSISIAELGGRLHLSYDTSLREPALHMTHDPHPTFRRVSGTLRCVTPLSLHLGAEAMVRAWKTHVGPGCAAGRRDGVRAMNFVRHFCLIATAAFVLAVWPALLARAQTSTADQLGHTGAVNSAAFSPDGTRIVTASNDKTARLWDAKTGAALATLSGHTDTVWSAAFSPDGTRIVTASDDNTARLWDAKTGAALATLSGHTDTVNSAAFSPDGSRIVTASDDKTARLWDAKTGAALATLSGHTDAV